MSNDSQMLETLRKHRPLLLACEAIGWLHMLGKAKADFLRRHGGQPNTYKYERWFDHEEPPFPWSDLRVWMNGFIDERSQLAGALPESLVDFLTEHTERGRGLLGLLQAGHAMASGIEKNLPRSTSGYLNQDVTHMWMTSPFGHPVRNLLADPPFVLTPKGWKALVGQVRDLLEELKRLGESPPKEPEPWHTWREAAIGPEGWLRQALLSTLAETRLPNNDVTLWDQSYIAAALFKAAVAGAILTESFAWQDPDLKSKTQWRVLSIGFGTDHYEARAVRIGDWVGARCDINRFFDDVSRFIEVEIAVGSLVYRDEETLAFTFPGQQLDSGGGLSDRAAEKLRREIERQTDQYAQSLHLETPPSCRLSSSTRSFIPMATEIEEARRSVAIPIHRLWEISDPGPTQGHVCPVCLVRLNGQSSERQSDNAKKQRVCTVCAGRRRGRLDQWLRGGEETIWITEVADSNDRLALLTLSFDLEPWLNGERVDSLRAQSLEDWKQHNRKVSRSVENQIKLRSRASLQHQLEKYFEKRLTNPPKRVETDGVLRKIIPGLEEEFSGSGSTGATGFSYIFQRLVEDRTRQVSWSISHAENAKWFVFQAFRKLPSPGRIYRFWRAGEEFFDDLLLQFREISSAHYNRWRTKRLLLGPSSETRSSDWRDRETYIGHWRGAPFEVLYLSERQAFLTICNLARASAPQDVADFLVQDTKTQPLELRGDDGVRRRLQVASVATPPNLGVYCPVIPLDRSPQRFRVLVPLKSASNCVVAALARWQAEFARVWDRLPLRIGIVAFPRLTPFQAVIEAARNLEENLAEPSLEHWRVANLDTRGGTTAIQLQRPDGGDELITIPTRLPDGRTDVFYPYVRVEDRAARHSRDFQHPNGQVYRHVLDLQPGDGIKVAPSRVATLFLDTTGRRFGKLSSWPASSFRHMRQIWALLQREKPSITSLRGAWSELVERRRSWRGPDGEWLPGGRKAWMNLVRSVLRQRLSVNGAALDTLVDAADDGTLGWAIEWHLSVLKENLED